MDKNKKFEIGQVVNLVYADPKFYRNKGTSAHYNDYYDRVGVIVEIDYNRENGTYYKVQFNTVTNPIQHDWFFPEEFKLRKETHLPEWF